MNSALMDEHIPVIVGVGQLLNRPTSTEEALDPFKLILAALDIANQDSRVNF